MVVLCRVLEDMPLTRRGDLVAAAQDAARELEDASVRSIEDGVRTPGSASRPLLDWPTATISTLRRPTSWRRMGVLTRLADWKRGWAALTVEGGSNDEASRAPRQATSGAVTR